MRDLPLLLVLAASACASTCRTGASNRPAGAASAPDHVAPTVVAATSDDDWDAPDAPNPAFAKRGGLLLIGSGDPGAVVERDVRRCLEAVRRRGRAHGWGGVRASQDLYRVTVSDPVALRESLVTDRPAECAGLALETSKDALRFEHESLSAEQLHRTMKAVVRVFRQRIATNGFADATAHADPGTSVVIKIPSRIDPVSGSPVDEPLDAIKDALFANATFGVAALVEDAVPLENGVLSEFVEPLADGGFRSEGLWPLESFVDQTLRDRVPVDSTILIEKESGGEAWRTYTLRASDAVEIGKPVAPVRVEGAAVIATPAGDEARGLQKLAAAGGRLVLLLNGHVDGARAVQVGADGTLRITASDPGEASEVERALRNGPFPMPVSLGELRKVPPPGAAPSE